MGGCCILALIGAFWPRLVLIILWALNLVLKQGFAGVYWLWPILGFLFLPTTTLAYALIKYWGHGIDSPWMAVMALAFLHDLGTFRGVAKRRRAVVVTTERERFVDPG